MQENVGSGRLFVGAIVVLVGIWLLLTNLDVVNVGQPWRYLPSVIWILGLWALIRTGFRQLLGPVLLIAIGVAVQLTVLDQVPEQVRTAVWPVAIIVVGIAIVWRGSLRSPRAVASTPQSDFSAFAAFYGAEQRVNGPLRGGQITTLFGGANVDLRDASVGPSPAVLDVTCIFGGAELRAPADWNIRNDVIALFGGVSDERRSPAEPAARPPQLSIQGVVLFGGLTIKD